MATNSPEPDWRAKAEAVHAHLPRLHAQFEQILEQLVAVPTVSAHGENLERYAVQLVEVMRMCGLVANDYPTPGGPIVVGSYQAGSTLPTVLVYGHYDVQPVEPLDAWHSDPFQMRRTRGRFVGRGTADNKAQHLAQLMAIRAVLDVYAELPINVHVIVEGQEEVGSPFLSDWLRKHASSLGGDLAYTSDGAVHPSGRPVVVCGARGLLYLDVSLAVSDTDRHSGNFSRVARNAAHELAGALVTLWDEDSRVAVPEFYNGVRGIDDVTRAAVAALPRDARAKVSRGVREVSSSEEWFARVLLEPALNLAGFESGWTGQGMKTVIPATARAKLDARLVPDQRPADVARALRDHLQRQVSEIEVSVTASMLPSRTSLADKSIGLVMEAVEHGWGTEPLLYPSLSGSLPDAAFTIGLGIPSLVVPYGNADQANHAPNENMTAANFHAGARVFVSVLHALAANRTHWS